MTNIFNCPTNNICVQQFVEFFLTLVTLFFGIDGWRYVRKVQDNLSDSDRLVYNLSLISVILQCIYYLFSNSDSILSSIRFLGIIIQIFLVSIFADICLSNTQLTWLISKIILGIVILEWFWTTIIHRSTIDYNCVQIDFVLLSTTGFLISLCGFLLGMEICSGIRESIRALEVKLKGTLSNHNVIKAQINEAQLSHDKIFILAIGGILQFTLQIGWDWLAYSKSTTADECVNFYYGTGVMELILGVLKFLSLQSLQISAYWAFYYKNKNSLQAADKLIEMF